MSASANLEKQEMSAGVQRWKTGKDLLRENKTQRSVRDSTDLFTVYAAVPTSPNYIPLSAYKHLLSGHQHSKGSF